MNLRLRLSHKGILLVAIPLIFELVFIIVLYQLLQRAELEAQRANHYKAVTSQTNKIVTDLYEGVSTLVTFHLNNAAATSKHYTEVISEIPNEEAALKQLVADDAFQTKTLNEIEPDLTTVLRFMTQLKENIGSGNPMSAIISISRWDNAIRLPFMRLMTRLHDLAAYQKNNLNFDPQEEARLRQLFKMILSAGIVGNVLLALFTWKLTTGITRRVEVLTGNTLLLAERRQLLPMQEGDDEISRLDTYFHHMAEALNEAYNKELAIVQNAIDVIFSLDLSGKFSKISPACKSAWGYDPEELIGKHFAEIVNWEDRSQTTSAIHSIISDQKSEPFEARVVRKDLHQIYTLFSAQWVPSERSLFCVGHDISVRKEAEDLLKRSEAKIRSIIESMQVGLAIVDEQGIVMSINPRMERLFKYPEAELVGKNMAILLNNNDKNSDQANSTASFHKDLLDNALNKIFETTAITRTGDSLPVEIMASSLGSLDNPGYIVNFLDISERREVERLKREFVAMVSHDLRTPLTSVLSAITLLSTGAFGSLSAKGAELVENSENELSRLMQLINDLLDIARMESGRMEFHFQEVQLHKVIESSVNAVRGVAQHSNITITAPPEEHTLIADGDRLIQVLVNLLSNAIKFSPANSEISIGFQANEKETEVSVTDSGRGVPEASKDKIFERWQQVQPSDSKLEQGTGLGLAICKTIVAGHHGSIGVRSEGKGSTFWFKIPNRQDENFSGTA